MSIKNPTHPGAGIQDDLDELGWTVTEAARRMGVRRENLSLLIHGQIGISPKTCTNVSQCEFWMRRQAGYEWTLSIESNVSSTTCHAHPGTGRHGPPSLPGTCR